MLLALVVMTASAQERFQRRPCMRFDDDARANTRALPEPLRDWDPTRTYHQVVLLVEFADSTFSMENPKTYYDQLLNLTTSNTRGGVGCAADYFRDQSKGLFNVQFDVYGPIKVSQSAKTKYDNYGEEASKEAIKKSVDSLHVDYTPYDWNNDGLVEQVVVIAANYCANGGNADFSKFIWPNTGFISKVNVSGDKKVNQISVSAEKWYNDIPCGIGTIVHEYTHCLGLPDLYPVSGTLFSMVDEWDLMDGGNFTGWGWCPPNFSAFEKNLLNWLDIEEISEPCNISDMKPVADGGKAYKMTKEGNEFYLMENRQQTGWDIGLPGKGLTIYHINYNATDWKYNNVNTPSNYRYTLLHADGMDYDAWDEYVAVKHLSEYVNDNRMNRRHLSTSAYPFVSDTSEVRKCDETPMLISHIELSDAGTISFAVENGTGMEAIDNGQLIIDNCDWYDLQGRKLNGKPTRKGLYIHNRKKVIF